MSYISSFKLNSFISLSDIILRVIIRLAIQPFWPVGTLLWTLILVIAVLIFNLVVLLDIELGNSLCLDKLLLGLFNLLVEVEVLNGFWVGIWKVVLVIDHIFNYVIVFQIRFDHFIVFFVDVSVLSLFLIFFLVEVFFFNGVRALSLESGLKFKVFLDGVSLLALQSADVFGSLVFLFIKFEVIDFVFNGVCRLAHEVRLGWFYWWRHLRSTLLLWRLWSRFLSLGDNLRLVFFGNLILNFVLVHLLTFTVSFWHFVLLSRLGLCFLGLRWRCWWSIREATRY